MRFLILLTFMLISFNNTSLFAQTDFGDITDEELQMTSLEQDPEADYIILHHIGEMEFDTDFNLEFKVRKRIKILSEAGKEEANISIPYYYKEKIHSVEAYSWLPNGDEFELDDDNIQEDQIFNTKYKKFSIPGVEVGSVIEYKYTLISRYISNLEPWYFQDEVFTRLSKLTIYLPIGFTYSVFRDNWNLNEIKFTEGETYRKSKRTPVYTWEAENILPIKEEPYMTAAHDYYAKVLFQLVSYISPYVNLSFAKSWDDIAKDHWSTFEKKIDDDGDHNDFIKTLLKNSTPELDKAKQIYNYVKDKIVTEGSGGWYPGKDPEDIFESQKSSASEKNVFLLNLLINEGFKAHPLLISTRSHGKIYESWPNIIQFNRTIVLLEFDKKQYFLDTNNKYCPFGYLVPNLDVEKALKIEEEKAYFINMSPEKFVNKLSIETELSIEDDNTIAAKTNLEYQGYYTVLEKNRVYNSDDLDKHIKNKLEDTNVEAKIDTFYYTNLDSIDLPVTLTIEYQLPGLAEVSENLIYLTVPFILRLNKNPFVHENRSFPVDYDFVRRSSEIVNINFPQGYNLSERPLEKKSQLQRFNYSKIFFTKDKSLECRRSFEIGRKNYPVTEYPKLKSAYDSIVESDQQIVVLEKNAGN